ncbi:hypothetical protein CJF30_00010153 [Rutstroemia sp. NJR-2017a BBW]|nr:hypothetical protein CJF30_00010153 [Rutstroemia sp. NJR-2017a BBW]
MGFDVLERRPISLPNEHDSYYNLPLPPKRELPFVAFNRKSCIPPHSASSSEPIAGSESRKRSLDESTGHEVTPSVGTTFPAKTATKRRVASRKPSVQKETNTTPFIIANSTPKEIVTTTLTTSTSEDANSLITRSYGTVLESSSKSSKLVAKQTATQERREEHHSTPIAMVNSATQTQTLSGRDHTAAIRVPQPVSTADASTNTTAPSSFQDDLELFLKKHGDTSQIELPPSYNEAPDDVRNRMINEFICQNLENENFLTLVRDMEVSWPLVDEL